MPITHDEIQTKYLERAIRELNCLMHDLQSCDQCRSDNRMPVLGSGHPQADIFMLKFAPLTSEMEEGVAFYGRTGTALLKAFKRLGIDPLTVYGTVCVKCSPNQTEPANKTVCTEHLTTELTIVAPKVIVVMGEEALHAFNKLELGLAQPMQPTPGEIQKLTPSLEGIYTPNIDEALNDETSKKTFWQAFKQLGVWYSDLPPY